MTDLSTTNKAFTTPSGTTPFNVDVTICNLSDDADTKDFVVYIDGELNSLTNWTKLNATTIQYGGTAFDSTYDGEVRRVTPPGRIQEMSYGDKIDVTYYEAELNKLARQAYEYELNGIGPSSTVVSYIPIDDAYNSSEWDADTIYPPTRNAVRDVMETKAPIASPTFTGTPTAPTPTAGDSSTKVSTTAFVATHVSSALSNSPTLGGNPTCSKSQDSFLDDDTGIATTAWVQDEFVKRYRLKVYRKTSNQSLNATGSYLIYNNDSDTGFFDLDSAYNTSTGVYTAPLTGWYKVMLKPYISATYTTTTTIYAYTWLDINSGGFGSGPVLHMSQAYSTAIFHYSSTTADVYLSSTDTVRIGITFQNSNFSSAYSYNVSPDTNGNCANSLVIYYLGA
jgi:hypothetical protein